MINQPEQPCLSGGGAMRHEIERSVRPLAFRPRLHSVPKWTRFVFIRRCFEEWCGYRDRPLGGAAGCLPLTNEEHERTRGQMTVSDRCYGDYQNKTTKPRRIRLRSDDTMEEKLFWLADNWACAEPLFSWPWFWGNSSNAFTEPYQFPKVAFFTFPQRQSHFKKFHPAFVFSVAPSKSCHGNEQKAVTAPCFRSKLLSKRSIR